jgi:methyltransferase, FkbM family
MRKLVARWVKNFLRRRGYRLIRADANNSLESFMFHIIEQRPLTFVQIGANDGHSADPLYEFVTFHHARVRGLVVEPVEDYFDELVQTYRGYPSIVPVRAAIHRTKKEMTIYRPRPGKRLRKGIASFDPDHYRRFGIDPADIVAEKVRCMTLDELLDEHGIRQLDVLQIDTEGYDAEIVRGIRFDRVRPGIIRFEHGYRANLMTPATHRELTRLLHAQGYEIVIERRDTTAYLPEIMLGEAAAVFPLRERTSYA